LGAKLRDYFEKKMTPAARENMMSVIKEFLEK
jgi:hypothetical protein